jgi:battenin
LNVPKAVVLLADVVPSFGAKLVAPYLIHLVPYSARVIIFALLSTLGMLMIALTPSYIDGGTISTKLIGVVLASLSSGGGELSFVGLTHYYGPFSLSAWGSGTGAAGLVGAGAYALATTSLGLSVKATLLASACLPAIMLMSFFVILPLGPLRYLSKVPSEHPTGTDDPDGIEEIEAQQEGGLSDSHEQDGLLGPPRPAVLHHRAGRSSSNQGGFALFKANLERAKGLFFPLCVPSQTY